MGSLINDREPEREWVNYPPERIVNENGYDD